MDLGEVTEKLKIKYKGAAFKSERDSQCSGCHYKGKRKCWKMIKDLLVMDGRVAFGKRIKTKDYDIPKLQYRDAVVVKVLIGCAKPGYFRKIGIMLFLNGCDITEIEAQEGIDHILNKQIKAKIIQGTE